MFGLLRQRRPTAVFDRSPRGRGRFGVLLTHLQQVARYLRCVMRRRSGVVLYVALSGGWGQAVDFAYLLFARIFCCQIFVHHHSFSYFNRVRPINRLVFTMLRRADHIVLSEGMGRALAERYGIPSKRIRTLSNAAFFQPAETLEGRPGGLEEPISIGFNSNITLAKGFMDFFEVLKGLSAQGVSYRACIAGAMTESACGAFEQLLRDCPHVRYLGAVEGEAQLAFYRSLDVLLFPSRYVNEAEPLVLHEAMQQSVHVIACGRGSIPEMLANDAGIVLSPQEFVELGVAQISAWVRQPELLRRAQERSLVQAQRLQREAADRLEQTLSAIVDAKLF
jgi:glycosyltransferase involved in cell wall biosynthesis